MLAGPLRQIGLRLEHAALQVPRGLKQQVVFVTCAWIAKRACQQDEIDHLHSASPFRLPDRRQIHRPETNCHIFMRARRFRGVVPAAMPLNRNENFSILP